MSKFIITEEEKKNILSQYNLINEQDYGAQRLNLGEISGKTYEFYLQPGKKSEEFKFPIDSSQPRPTPKAYLPKGKNRFLISPKTLTYWSGETPMNYSFVTKPVTDGSETYSSTSLYTDKNMIKTSQFLLTIAYKPDSPKSKWRNERFYAYSDDLKNDMVANKLINLD
jgi:hypothetical protein